MNDMNSMEKLKYEILHNKYKTAEEWFDLKRRIVEFMKSDAPKQGKKELSQYTEMVEMMCSGFEYFKITRI